MLRGSQHCAGPWWTHSGTETRAHQNSHCRTLRPRKAHRDGLKMERGMRQFSPRAQDDCGWSVLGRRWARAMTVEHAPGWGGSGDAEAEGVAPTKAQPKCSRRGSLYRVGMVRRQEGETAGAGGAPSKLRLPEGEAMGWPFNEGGTKRNRWHDCSRTWRVTRAPDVAAATRIRIDGGLAVGGVRRRRWAGWA
jgi:hypothetical protein